MTSFGATTPITSRTLNTAFLQLESLISSPNANSLSGTTLAANVVNSSLTSVGTLVSGSIPATLLTGFVASARLSGSYTGITGLGTLTSLTVDGANSPAITIGDWSGSSSNSAIASNSGHLILGTVDGAVYLRTNNTGAVYIGANGTNTLTVGNAVVTVAGSMNATTFSGSGASLTSLPAAQLTGTVSSLQLSGSYSGITGLGTLTTLTIGGAGANRVITINAPTGFYAIQYFQIGGVFKWHYEVNPAGDRWSLVQTGVAERIGVDSARLAFDGAGSPSIQMGDWSSDSSYSAIQTSRGYLLLGRASADDGIYLRSSGASPVHIGQGGQNALIVGTADITIAGALRLPVANSAIYSVDAPGGLPWSNGPVVQGTNGWAFYSTQAASYRMGFRGSTGGTRYMWCADNALIGAQPNDASVTTTFNVIGNMRTTTGYYGSITYGSYGSLTIRGTNNGYAGIATPDVTSAVMWQNGVFGAIFGHYINDNAWNFYVINGTYTPSDARYKRDIQPLEHGMNFIREIVPVTYDPLTQNPNDDPDATVGRTHYGFTTQNILQALTNAGETRDVAIVDIGGPDSASAMGSDRQYLNHSGLIAPIVKAIQELDLRLQQLETV